MHNGLFVKSTVWTFNFLLCLCFVSGSFSPVLAGSSLENELEIFRKEIAAINSIVSGMPYPDPGPSDIEDLSKKSPSKARILLQQAQKKFTETASNYINAEIVTIGKSVDTSPTDMDNYDKRRTILVALEDAAKKSKLSVSSLFPRGAPSTHLPVSNASTPSFDYCDNSFRYLATLLFKKLPPELKSGIGGGSSGGTEDGTKTDTAPISAPAAETHSENQKDTPVQSRDLKQPKNPWQIIGTYFYWVLYVMGILFAVGVTHHLYKTLSRLSSLDKSALKSGKDDVKMYKNATTDFKSAMRHFKANRFEKALEGFNSLNENDEGNSHNVRFFRIISEIRLCQTDRALRRIEEETYAAFTLEELYRIGHSLEDIGDLKNSINIYKIVKERDRTFRNISQRINSVEQKMNLKSDAGKE